MIERKSSKQVKSLFIGLVIFILLIFLQLFFYSSISSLTYAVAKPFWNLRDKIFGGTTDISLYTDSKSALIQNIKSLEDEMYALQIQNLELSSKISALSNIDLQSILSLEGERTLAKVFSKPPYSPYDSLVIGAGKDKGILVGNPVYVGKNIIIGKVSEVLNSSSKVLLFSSGSNSSSADILRTGESVNLKGQGGGNFNITLPKEFDITVGDVLVSTSSRQSIVAKVYYIDSSSGGSFKKVLARIPISIFDLEWVSISAGQ